MWTQSGTNNGFKLTDYAPKYFAITALLSSSSTRYIWYYNKNINSSAYYSINSADNSTLTTINFSTNSSVIMDNNFILKLSSNWVGDTLYYMVCK